MTPHEFMNKYRQMAVTLDGEQTAAIDVHRYMINRESSSSFKRVQQSLEMKDKIVAGLNAEVAASKKTKTRDSIVADLGPGLTPAMLWLVPYGKASPRAAAAFARLAVRYKHATKDKLQAFADDYLGLDCSGFVTQFKVALGKLAEGEGGNFNAKSYDVAAKRRATLAAVADRDTLVWSDGGHIAIISGKVTATPQAGKPQPKYTCQVVQSSGGGGLHASQYTLVSVTAGKLFTVQAAGGGTASVYIVDSGLTG